MRSVGLFAARAAWSMEHCCVSLWEGGEVSVWQKRQLLKLSFDFYLFVVEIWGCCMYAHIIFVTDLYLSL